MAEIDLDPGNYRDRKPGGWRWKLPWSHADDVKLPMVMFFLSGGFLLYFFANLPPGTSLGICAGIAVFAAGAGAMMVLWLRD